MKHKPAIGIIGAGMVAGILLDGLLKTGRVNVLWLADVDKKNPSSENEKI